MKMLFPTLTGLAALALAAPAVAQTPRGKATAMVGGHEVSVDYGRPALKGRDLGALLDKLPPDRMWRAGENQVTTLTTAGALSIGGTTVPAGTYSVYVHAGEGGDWSLVLNKDPGVPLGQMWDQAPENLKNEPWPHLDDYTKAIADKEVVRASMKKVEAAPADLFTISLTPKGDGAQMTLAWGNQAWAVSLQPAS
jgi:hypothetical protein